MTMKLLLPLLASSIFVMMAASTRSAVGQTTGTSHPESLNDPVDATVAAQPHYVKPSPAVPADAAPAPALQTRSYAATDDHYVPPDAAYNQEHSHPFVPGDVNSGVVIDVPTGPNELPIGTRLVGNLNSTISTKETHPGTHFVAALAHDVVHQGNVLLPAGTLVSGRITQIHGGRRISGASAIRLQPDEVVLPDRSIYHLNAEVVDLDHFNGSHVGHEGTIVNNSNPKATVAILGGTTVTTTVAGALIGGGVGAVVGAGIGAGVGTVWWLRQDHQQTLPQGTEIVFSLDEPLIVGSATN